MIKKIINKILKNLGNYDIHKIIPKAFSDLKSIDLETAMKICNLMRSNIEKKDFINYKEFFKYFKKEKDFEFLSIDFEGNEMAGLEGFDIDYWLPKIVIIENNFHKENMNLISKLFLENCYKKELELLSFNNFWFTNF